MTQRPKQPPAGRRHRFTAAALAAALTLAAVPPVLAQGSAPRGRVAPATPSVTLNFVNAEIDSVSRAMAAMMERPIVVDPRVKGQITLYSEQPLTVREAYLNYLSALRGLGFAVVENSGLLKVVPEADAKLQAGTVTVGPTTPMRGDQIVTQVFRLNYENANNLVTVLRPLISPNNTINANPGNNSLVITDYADNVQRLARIVAALDVPAGTDVDVVPLKHAVAADMAALVQRLADGGAGGAAAAGAAPTPGTGGGAVSVFADARSNALILRAANPARLGQLRAIVERLDQPQGPGNAAGNIYVVYLRNADAVRLATVLRAAFSSLNTGGGAAGGGTSPFGGAGTVPTTGFASNASLAGGNVTSLGGTTAGGTASVQSSSPVAPSAQPSVGGFVQADPATNSLVITAPEPLYRQIRAVIDQLDSRRAQVYVEALIVELDAGKAAELGLQWQLGGQSNNGNTTAAGGTNFGTGLTNIFGVAGTLLSGTTAAAQAAANAPNGFNFGLLSRNGGLAVLARALETNTGANILSTPNLLTLDNEEAKIVVGRNVPFITGQFTSTGTGTTNPFQTIERRDVGLTLRIKPQIGENGTVRMTIYQENSQLSTESIVGATNAGPSTTKRSIESTVVVDDGEVIVLGGLIEDNYRTDRAKVPLLGDLPGVGALFRSESRSRNRTNLMVFLRPVVMRDQVASSAISLDRYDMMRNLQIQAQPEARRLLPVNESPVMAPATSNLPGARNGARPVPAPLNPPRGNEPDAQVPSSSQVPTTAEPVPPPLPASR
ncbi:type II secretion system secretin GspD [Aquabacterium sp. J223]|uniref:type II secretion system secretin GspD n=1 Tax=Aquabacterium sp. J223 TaxID=2898431 RepID=UPI0021ADDB1F|nr:type II secretion system secretin GspD [Aquabacterium sp. J223]UUX96515.1 type II secretion system secretin GspD [Aquabacterium sp. J223]